MAGGGGAGTETAATHGVGVLQGDLGVGTTGATCSNSLEEKRQEPRATREPPRYDLRAVHAGISCSDRVGRWLYLVVGAAAWRGDAENDDTRAHEEARRGAAARSPRAGAQRRTRCSSRNCIDSPLGRH